MDIAAPSAVIGVKELRRICGKCNRRVGSLKRSNRRFRFGNTTFESLGTITLPLAVPYGIHALDVNLDVVAADVPVLVGLDFLDMHSLMVDTVTNRLTKRTMVPDEDSGAQHVMDEWHMPLTRKHNHLYAEMSTPASVLYTTVQLRKAHCHFCHASAGSLYKLLKTADPKSTTPETVTSLEDLTKRCDPCQRVSIALIRFRVALSAENARFKETILVEIMYIGEVPVLHLIDEGVAEIAVVYRLLRTCRRQ